MPDALDEFALIEARLHRAGVPVARLLEQANIDRSTWTRWRSGGTGPRLRTWRKVIVAAEALCRLESDPPQPAPKAQQALLRTPTPLQLHNLLRDAVHLITVARLAVAEQAPAVGAAGEFAAIDRVLAFGLQSVESVMISLAEAG